MTRKTDPGPTTLLEAVLSSLRSAAGHQPGVEERPAAILWADPKGEWRPVIALLRDRLPQLLVLGEFDPKAKRGPAIWIKCAIAGVFDDVDIPEGEVPIIYMPGVSRQSLRATDECPRELQPLVELQYRGAVWAQRNGRDWTVEAMLTSDDGLGLDLARDAATKQSMHASLHVVAITPAVQLQGRLEADDFDRLMVTDHPRNLLMWMNAPETVQARMIEDGKWHAFKSRCQKDFGFDPESDGHLVAGEKLGRHEDAAWADLWQRFKDSPAIYPGVHELLRRSKPTGSLAFDKEPWPDENEEAESRLRAALLETGTLDAAAARKRVLALETEHGMRRGWVWAKLDKCVLAESVGHLARLAHATQKHIGGDTPDAMATLYAEGGVLADDAAIQALATIKSNADAEAVGAAVRAMYLPWAEAAAEHLQKLIKQSPLPGQGRQSSVEADVGTCILFVDGLRFDLGERLAVALEERGLIVTKSRRWAALPTVTATAKPAVSPVAARLGADGLDESFSPNDDQSKPLTTARFRKLLGAAGYMYLEKQTCGDPGAPDARGWTEIGQIDKRGHDLGVRLAEDVGHEIEHVVERLIELLEGGWLAVRVVTDHGWLLLPGGLPRHDLPSYLTECKWARCAAIKGSSSVAVPTAHWHWDSRAEFATAPGIRCFSAGHEYAHGGISLQECVIPDLLVRPRDEESGSKAAVVDVQWVGLRCRVTVEGHKQGMSVDIRTKAGAAESSIATGTKPVGDDGRVGLIVSNEDLEGAAAVIVVLDASGRPVAKHPTSVGGDE